MRAQPLGAVLSVSIDSPAAADHRGGPALSREKEILGRLVELVAELGQPATWFADDPANNRAVREVLSTDTRHEAALRVDADWIGDGSPVGRNRFVAQVIERTSRARRAGMRISTLATHEAGSELPAELLVKYGITAIRADSCESRNRGSASGPQSLRYGLWRIASDFRIAGGGPIADWLTAFRIRRAIDRCIKSETPMHLAIDVAAIAANRAVDRLGGLPAILRHVERRCKAGRLRVCTIAEVVARLAAPASPRATGSILRAA